MHLSCKDGTKAQELVVDQKFAYWIRLHKGRKIKFHQKKRNKSRKGGKADELHVFNTPYTDSNIIFK